MENVENIISMGLDVYLKREKKKSKNKFHFIKSTNIKELDIILTHRNLSHFRFLIQDHLKQKDFKMNGKINIEWTLDNRITFNYFYIFFHESICVYFFGKEGKDYLFFEGLHKWTDLKNIHWIKWIQKKKMISKDVFMKKGILFQMEGCSIVPFEKGDFWDIFHLIENKYYKTNSTIPLICEGYSLGGIYLQLWIQSLQEKKQIDHYQLETYQIESWFQGSEEEYYQFQKSVNIKNIMKYGSYLHLFNSLYQKYRIIDFFIPESKDTQDILKSNSIFKTVEYGITSHIL